MRGSLSITKGFWFRGQFWVSILPFLEGVDLVTYCHSHSARRHPPRQTALNCKNWHDNKELWGGGGEKEETPEKILSKSLSIYISYRCAGSLTHCCRCCLFLLTYSHVRVVHALIWCHCFRPPCIQTLLKTAALLLPPRSSPTNTNHTCVCCVLLL